jgi:peptide/nickel transport system substrate-binding protein
MVRSSPGLLRALTAGVAAALVLAACGTSTTSSGPSGGSGGTTGQGQPGGTIFILSQAEQWDQVDPQRAYTGEDLAFFGATIYRSLVAYKYSADPVEGTSLVPDLATDLGTHNDDATQWSFTLRDGATFQDGSPVTCEDVKYGTSRTFATDVINQGPTYQIAYLDIPTDKDGSSAYKGPYKKTGQDLYDKAVTCDGNTITFNLNKPVPDFNYTTTLGFSPVPKDADTGETYGDNPVSSGPYQIDSYETGNGGKMILVRNPNWNKDSDTYRKAYPDRWEVDFGIDPKVMDQRLMQSTGDDATAIQYGNVQPENLATIFTDPKTTAPQFAGRATSDYDPYSLYIFVNVQKVPNVKIRQAMAVALDRQALRLNAGGAFAGDLADGVIKPNIGQDYAPTGMWTDMFGQAVPDNGDPELAKKLIQDSGEAAPTLQYDYPQTPTNDKSAAIVKDSLEKAGFTVKPNPIEPGVYYSVVFDPKKAGEFGSGGWGADWPNASTVIPPLFTQKGGWDLSEVDDPDFNAQVEDAQTELDRAAQAKKWQDLNKLAMQNVYVIPTRFGLTQTIAGDKVQPTYQWPAYGSWPYAEMYVTQ